MKVYAHRGVSAEAPENTLAAFVLALDLGVEGVELDVRLSADGVPVVVHDERLDRTTSGTGRVGDLTVDELRSLDAGDGQPVPTLGEVVELLAGRVLLDVEIKAPGAESATLATLAALEFSQWAISSFDWDVLRTIRRMSSAAELWPLSRVASEEAVMVAKELDAPLLALHAGGLDAEIIGLLRDHSLGFMAWTVNDPQRAREIEELGAFALCTDDPRPLLLGR